MIRLLLICFLTLGQALACPSQFVEVTAAHNIHSLNTGNLYGNGVSFYDFNHDGWDDLSMASGAQEPQFFINNQGQFEPISFGALNSEGKQVHAIQWIDWDNDGDSDLFITRLNATPRLMRNDGNLSFTDITATSGINQGIYIYLGAAWTDYDKDGFLDFYLSKYYNPNTYPGNDFISRMYKGNGDGTFVDVTQSAGVFLPPRPCFQPVWFDYNSDGWEDLYLIIDRNSWRNEMFRNNGNGTFTNVTDETGTGVFIDAMTGTVGDYDNDLDFDIYVTNGYAGNKLFRNEADGTYSEIAEELGLEVGAICWGANWIDYDNNTWQDLYVSATGSFYGPYQNQFFINDQNGGFYDGIEEVGIEGDISPSMATTMGDINNDGYYDYFNANNAPYEADLWQNLGGQNHWLGVELEGTTSNKDGFGTILKLYANGHTYIRCAHGGENFLGQNSGKEIFGLGESTSVDSLEIFWPLGLREVYFNIAADQYLNFKEGDSDNTPIEIAIPQTIFCEVDSLILSSQQWDIISWNDGTINDTLMVFGPGEFSALVRDNEGHLFYTIPLVISEFLMPEYMLNTGEIQCHGDSNGTISFQLSNEADVNFLLWNEGEYFGNAISGLDSGTYSLEINYAQNCTVSDEVLLQMPEELMVSGSVNPVTCAGYADGIATLVVSGGTGVYTFHWNGLDPLALPPDEYSIEITDDNNCSVFYTFEITQPEPLQIVLQTSPVSCYAEGDGSAWITSIEGGNSGYQLDWNGLDTTALFAGNYFVTLHDALGCELIVPYAIDQPSELIFTSATSPEFENGIGGSITVDISGGIAPYQIFINDVIGSTYTEELAAGNYVVTVIDSNGCVVNESTSIDFINTVIEGDLHSVYLFPNPAVDWLMIQNLEESQDILIFDSSGKLVESWVLLPNGAINVETLAAGWYIIRFANGSIPPLYFLKD